MGRTWVSVACLALTLSMTAPARGQDAPPVPPAPGEAPAPADEAAPGFDDETEDTDATPKRRRPRAPGSEEPVERDGEPPFVSAPDASRYDRLVRNLADTTGEITLGELIDEILADVTAELALLPPNQVSPMAIRQVALGSNVKPAFAKQLKAAIVSAVHTGTRLRLRHCVECAATRTRIEGDEWVVTRGIVTTEELRDVGRRLGVRAFLDVSFGFDPESSVVEIHFELIRASDALILWAETFRADETTPLLLRSSDAPVRRDQRLRDLQLLLEGRPFFGYAVSTGFALIPYDAPDGDITGATVGFRVYERFGRDRRVMFGLDVLGFLNTERLAGAFLSAGAWWVPLPPTFIFPELRLGGKAGAFIAGSEGNAAAFQLGGEALLRYRFGVYAYAMFMTTSNFQGRDLGGLGVNTGLSFNW